jgi:hypothetical protein
MVLKLTSGPPPGPVFSPRASLETPQLELRGPAGGVEGEDQGKELPGRRDNFSSLDIRFKEDQSKEDQRSASVIVEEMTLFSRQKKGGQYKPPGFIPSSCCILCLKGCTCIGICCQGPKKPPKTSNYRLAPPSQIIPGLFGKTTLTTLTAPIKTTNRKLNIQCFRPSIFQWTKPSPVQPNQSAPVKLSRKLPKSRTKISAKHQVSYNPQKLKFILLHSPLQCQQQILLQMSQVQT